MVLDQIARNMAFVARDIFAETNSLKVYDGATPNGARHMRVCLRRIDSLMDQLLVERARMASALDQEDEL